MAKPPPASQMEKYRAISPSFVDYALNTIYGEVWERPGLSKRDRSMITVAAMIALARPEYIKLHISRALANGVTKDEIGEMITHLAFYTGWPAATTAAEAALAVQEAETAAQ